MRRWRVLIAILCLAALAAFLRIRHERIGWGDYWSVDVALPWR